MTHILCICEISQRCRISLEIRKKYDNYNIIYFDNYNSSLTYDYSGWILIISHSKIIEINDAIIDKFTEIYIYNNILINSSETDYLKKIQEEYLRKCDWANVKIVNDFFIDIDYLKRNIKSMGLPNYLQIETTNICNAKCIMCSHYFNNNVDADILSDSVLNNISDILARCRTVSLNGMGEPFISKRISEQIDYYASYGIRLVTNTNLSVINSRLITQIHDYFDWIEISCDGADKYTYESIRKNLKFDAFCHNLRRLRDSCPNIRLHIASVIMRQNITDMPELVKLAKKYGANIITFMTLNPNIIIGNYNDDPHKYPKLLEYFSVQALIVGRQLGMQVVLPNAGLLDVGITWDDVKNEYNKMVSEPLYKNIEEEKKMIESYNIVDNYLRNNMSDMIQSDTKPSNVKCDGICDWVFKKSYIDINGNVCLCCRNQSFRIGKIEKEGDFKKIWNGEFYQKIRDIFYSGYLPECCLKCGLIESGNLKNLHVSITDKFYCDADYKKKQIDKFNDLLLTN